MKTISDYPLLIGEMLRRAAVRQQRKLKWDRLLRRVSGGKFSVITTDTRYAWVFDKALALGGWQRQSEDVDGNKRRTATL